MRPDLLTTVRMRWEGAARFGFAIERIRRCVPIAGLFVVRPGIAAGYGHPWAPVPQPAQSGESASSIDEVALPKPSPMRLVVVVNVQHF